MSVNDDAIRRRDRRIWFVSFGVFVVVFLFAFLAQKFGGTNEAKAANLAAFDSGYIISDYQMSNYNSMDEGGIQAFLKSRNSCNDTDLGKYTTGDKVAHFSETSPPRTWHVANGHFVCMADEVFDGGTAAHIIYRAAQDYHINPQVLIVLLEKEQSLITDTFPHSQQYRSATGYGCPDTAACSSKYYGLQNQIRNAAALFRTVLDGGWTNYPLGNNYVQYNPNAACGGTVVNIRNLATSALYRYTPYQPNAAALGGWNDGCGAYGNMNFYKLFEDWFGGIKDEGWPSMYALMTTNRATTISSDVDIKYRSHIEHYGWLGWVDGGVMAGTAGYGYRMEGLALQLEGNNGSGIEYRAHVADRGWLNYVKDGELAGTTGQGLRMEAVQIRLTGELAKLYDVYYRVHVADLGWMDWVKNDEVAGTVGQSKQMEAVQIKIEKKVTIDEVDYQVHVQNIGWMDWVKNGELAGTTGESLRAEALKIGLAGREVEKSDIEYQVHVQNIGWMDWVKNGELAGTTGQGLQMEALRVKLTGDLAAVYDVYYRVHVQNIGWMDWVKNGELAGTTGESLRIEAIELCLADK